MNKYKGFCVIFLVICVFCQLCASQISDKRACADPECKTTISTGKTLITYHAPHPGYLSFQKNREVRILSKSAGTNKDLWGVDYQGKLGYVPKVHIKEGKMLFKGPLQYVVPTGYAAQQGHAEVPSPELKTSLPEVPSAAEATTPLPSESGNIKIVTKGASNDAVNKAQVSPTQTVLENEKPNTNAINGDPVAVNSSEQQLSDEYEDGDEEDDGGDDDADADDEDEEDEENMDSASNENLKTPAFTPMPTKTQFMNIALNTASHIHQHDGTQQESSPPPSLISENETVSVISEAGIPKVDHKEVNPLPTQTAIETDSVKDHMQIKNATLEHPASAAAESINSKASDNSIVDNSESVVPVVETPIVVAPPETAINLSADENKSNKEAALKNSDDLANQTVDNVNNSNATDNTFSMPEAIFENETISWNETDEVNKNKQEAENLQQEINKNDDKPIGLGQHTHMPYILKNTVVPNVKPSSEEATNLEVTGNVSTPESMPVPLPSVDSHSHVTETPPNDSTTPNNDSHMEAQYPILDSTTPIPPVVDNQPGLVEQVQQSEVVSNEQPENVGKPPASNEIIINKQPSVNQIPFTQPSSNEIPDDQSTSNEIPVDQSTSHEIPVDQSTSHEIPIDQPVTSNEISSESIYPPVDPQPLVQELSEPASYSTELPSQASNEQFTDQSTEQTSNENIDEYPQTSSEEQPESTGISDEKSIFESILETLSNLWPSSQSSETTSEEKSDDPVSGEIFTEHNEDQHRQMSVPDNEEFCERLTPNDCPKSVKSSHVPHSNSIQHDDLKSWNFETDFIGPALQKALEMTDTLILGGIIALTVLMFVLGHYCLSNCRKENTLISKLNIVERSLLASNKEAMILKHDLIETRNKLASIEDNSFGSNDMVIALKKELEDSEDTKMKLQEQVISLEKELENAAEAGLELNKIVSELLNNQSGDDSIISSVEELQKQLNEQQNTILEINTTLAEKSRENSELQLLLSEQYSKYQEDIKAIKEQNENLISDRDKLKVELDGIHDELENKIKQISREKDLEISRLTKELNQNIEKFNEINKKWQISDSRVEALESCLSDIKKDPKINIKEFMNVINLKADILAIRKERDSLKERFESEMDARKLLEDQVKAVTGEFSSLKQEYNTSEKEKLEAQTRLEVLSSYFKDKETQLQKELSVKEAMWLKQQGETTSTVERVRYMQDEIQSLKSQNDSFRAEIEAQSAAHKAQITSLENRAHDTWIAARQSERKLEEARSEATALRRKLTSIAGNSSIIDTSLQNRLNKTLDGMPNDINNVPSPIHMDTPGSPLLSGLPPPPFLPPPFMGPPPHPFMPMPPPFMPPGEMRPPPLGRLMSPPPPPPDRYSPSIVDERSRYSPENGRYSPDSRYNYNTDLMSTYDTETDLSPPPSPRSRSGGGGGSGGNGGGNGGSRGSGSLYNMNRDRDHRNRGYKAVSPSPKSDRSKKSKGSCYSESDDDFEADW